MFCTLNEVTSRSTPSTRRPFPKGGQPLEIVGHSLERQLELVFTYAQVTDPHILLPFLEVAEDSFDVATASRFAVVALMIFCGEVDVMGAFL